MPTHPYHRAARRLPLLKTHYCLRDDNIRAAFGAMKLAFEAIVRPRRPLSLSC